MEQPVTIDRSTYIEDLLRAYPKLVVPLEERGLACMRCGTVTWDTVEEAARKAHIDDIDGLVMELRELANPGED